MKASKFGFSKILELSYDEAVVKVTEELSKEGFGILTEIDVKATFKKKLDVDFKPYIILGACHPQSAYKAITSEEQIGLLLPCNVIVYVDDDEKTVVSLVNPAEMLGATDNEELSEVMNSVSGKLQRVFAAI